MKKVFFSAIMMIAFSGVSMANDIAEKRIEISDSKEIVSVNAEIGTGNPLECANLYYRAVQYYDSYIYRMMGESDWEMANLLAREDYNECRYGNGLWC